MRRLRGPSMARSAGPMAGVMALLAVAVLAGCGGSEDAAGPTATVPTPSVGESGSPTASADVETPGGEVDTADEPRVFEGTATEYTVQLRACLDDRGLRTQDPGPGEDPLAFSISMEGATNEEFIAITEECYSVVGSPYYAGMPEDELQRRYEARLEQFDCLVDLGLLTGEPISYELFVADFERQGYTTMWTPGAEVPLELIQGPPPVSPGDACPLGSF